jgi:hypothetical protein
MTPHLRETQKNALVGAGAVSWPRCSGVRGLPARQHTVRRPERNACGQDRGAGGRSLVARAGPLCPANIRGGMDGSIDLKATRRRVHSSERQQGWGAVADGGNRCPSARDRLKCPSWLCCRLLWCTNRCVAEQPSLFPLRIERSWLPGSGTLSRPRIGTCEDGMDYCIKHDEGGFPIRANEWIGTWLARAAGIAVARTAILQDIDKKLLFGSEIYGDDTNDNLYLLNPSE